MLLYVSETTRTSAGPAAPAGVVTMISVSPNAP
jgi:hypothetical protein